MIIMPKVHFVKEQFIVLWFVPSLFKGYSDIKERAIK